MQAVVRDARFDETFKILFGEIGAENRAISFLNAVLGHNSEADRIKKIQFLDRSLISVKGRSIHYDIKIQGLCETYSGHSFIIEMQKCRAPSHINRWMYYCARELTAIGKRLYRAANSSSGYGPDALVQKTYYAGLRPVKMIVILDFDSLELQKELENSRDAVVHWKIREDASLRVASNMMSWTYVILPRFSSSLPPSENHLDFTGKVLEAWLYLMTREDSERVLVTKELVANDLALAEGFYRISHLTPAEDDAVLEGQVAFATLMEIQNEKFDLGAKMKSEEIAVKMLLREISLDEIVSISGLSLQEIQAIASAIASGKAGHPSS